MARRTENPALEAFAVSPAKAGAIIDGGRTKVYELLAQGELESFWIGRSRKITVQSIYAYLDRRLTEARAAKAAPHSPVK
jgi:hypothetical protein